MADITTNANLHIFKSSNFQNPSTRHLASSQTRHLEKSGDFFSFLYTVNSRISLTVVFFLLLKTSFGLTTLPSEALPEADAAVILETLFIGAPAPAGADAGVPAVVTIPLKRVGRLFMIEATIDKETGNFLFDTGSQQLLLNSIYFRKYMTRDEVAASGTTGAVGRVCRTQVKQIDISGFKNDNVQANVTDLGHLENRRKVKIFGLFGFGLLKNTEVVIDAARNQMKIYRLDRSGNRLSAAEREFKSDITQKAVLDHNVLYLQGTVAGKSLSFCFDTGAETNVVSNFLPKKVMSTITISSQSCMNGVASTCADVLYGKMTDFSIGTQSFAGMQVIITDLESMAASFDHAIDGMLGFDFLERGVISVNLMTGMFKMSVAKGGKP